MGGSIRIPAALCGVVGLKPSYGRIPYDILPSLDNFCHFGPLARSVGDAGLFLNCSQGPDDRDLFSLPRGPMISLPIPTDLRGVTLAFSKDLGYYAVDPEVDANTSAAVELLRQQGARVEEVNLDWTSEINRAGWYHIWVTAAQMAGPYLKDSRALLDPATILSAEDGLKITGVEFKNVEEVRKAQCQKLAPVLQKYDALICPTTPIPAPLLGATDRDFGQMGDGGYQDFEMTLPFNLVSPCPAMTVPSGAASLRILADSALANGSIRNRSSDGAVIGLSL